MRYNELTFDEYLELRKSQRQLIRLKKDMQYIGIWLFFLIGMIAMFYFVAHMSFLLSLITSIGLTVLGALIDVFLAEGVRDESNTDFADDI